MTAFRNPLEKGAEFFWIGGAPYRVCVSPNASDYIKDLGFPSRRMSAVLARSRNSSQVNSQIIGPSNSNPRKAPSLVKGKQCKITPLVVPPELVYYRINALSLTASLFIKGENSSTESRLSDLSGQRPVCAVGTRDDCQCGRMLHPQNC